MASPSKSLSVNFFACCVLVLCALLVILLPILGQLWQVVPELGSVEVACRFQGLFLAMAGVCGLAAYCQRSSRLHALVGSCAVLAVVAACLTAVLLRLQASPAPAAHRCTRPLYGRGECGVDETSEVTLDNLAAVLLITLLSADVIALLATLAATVCCVVFVSRTRRMRCLPEYEEADGRKEYAPGLPPRRPRGESDMPMLTAARYHTTEREPVYSLPSKKSGYRDEPRLVMAPDDAPVLHLGRQPPGTVYVLPPGSLVMIESR
ncbi:hypothetical protein HPB49_025389 [Dermacentor silvarum]|uniref:Uncharacterized protein n=1 Tax=Dermacentor silvarum TaxID=543639 RepID=A0ACB8DLQ0_DERSI|nr:hypothetical protein HPB49_025389 [Dermacentor silvarum]